MSGSSPLPPDRRLRHWMTVLGADQPLAVVRARPTSKSGPTTPPVPAAKASPAAEKPPAEELDRLERDARACTACPLHTDRKQAVFADGSPAARIMFVGEAPGADEDRIGRPFVGRAGQLLTRIIENAMGMPRETVYIANVCKCRPPGNRNPTAAEQSACGHFLEAQIRLVRPDVIITLGKIATHFLVESDLPLTRMRGRIWNYEGIPVVPTWHPAHLLRAAEGGHDTTKRETWDDVRLALRTLGLPDRPAPYRRPPPDPGTPTP